MVNNFTNVTRQVKSVSNRVSKFIGTFDNVDKLVLIAAVVLVIIRRQNKKEA